MYNAQNIGLLQFCTRVEFKGKLDILSITAIETLNSVYSAGT